MKPAALETIGEYEDFVTTLTTLQGPNATASKAFKKAERGRRRRTLAAPSAFESIVAGTVPPEVFFAALWEVVGSLTRSSLTFHLGQLAKAVERGQNDSKLDILAFIDRILLRAALRPYSSITYEGHGTPFLSMLRDASIGTLLTIKAIAEKKMREDSDSMSWISTGSTDIRDGMIIELPPNEGP